MFEAEYRVVQIRSRYIYAEPLDGFGVQKIYVSTPRRFIENEVLVLAAIRRKADSSEARVIASRRDPSVLKVRPFKLRRVSSNQFEFEEYPSDSEEAEKFERILEVYRSGDLEEAGTLLRSFLYDYPLHIDSYHHLGNIDWKQGRLTRAIKYYEMGYRIGLSSLPENFEGQLPWCFQGNRPFLRAAHAYALLLSRNRRLLEACRICEDILRWDPQDELGILELLPRYYFDARAPELARSLLQTHRYEGMNSYTFALCQLMDGRRREALRTLCYAVTYNPYVLPVLLGERKPPRVNFESDYVDVGSEAEAAEYLLDFGRYWRREPYLDFVKTIMRKDSPFRRRFDRYLQLTEQLQRARDIAARERLQAQKRSILRGEDLRALLREAADTIFG